MPSKPIINIPGRYVWRLIFDHDNSGNAGECFTEIQISWSYSSQKFNETVTSSAKKLAESGRVELETGASYGAASVNVKAGYEASKEVSNALQETTREQREETVSYSRKETRKYTIGAHSKLVAYRRFFECAGVMVEEDIIITRPAALPDSELVKEVPVELMLEPQVFIKAIKVVYGDRPIQVPGDRVREWNNGNDDINSSFGGKFVWLVPEYTHKVSEALTSFDLVITDQGDERYSDLARGAGGQWRYLGPFLGQYLWFYPGQGLAWTASRTYQRHQ